MRGPVVCSPFSLARSLRDLPVRDRHETIIPVAFLERLSPTLRNFPDAFRARLPTMISEPSRPQASRSLSTPGLVVMGFGLGMAAFELRYGLVLMRLGNIGRIVVLTCAAGFSVWGLKELIAGWWPSLGGRSFTRHRSGFPVEGRIYLLILFVMFAGALLGRSNPLLLVFSAMAGPYIVNGWISFVLLKKLSVERKAPLRVMAGEPTSVEVVLKNGKRWLSAWVMIMRDRVSGPGEHLSAEVLVPRVPPRGERRVRYRMTLAKRGLYEIGPMSISTRFPLGLAERMLTVESSSSILVYPRIGRLTAQWQMRMQSATDLVPHSSPRSGPFDDEFHKLREYRPGDDPPCDSLENLRTTRRTDDPRIPGKPRSSAHRPHRPLGARQANPRRRRTGRVRHPFRGDNLRPPSPQQPGVASDGTRRRRPRDRLEQQSGTPRDIARSIRSLRSIPQHRSPGSPRTRPTAGARRDPAFCSSPRGPSRPCGGSESAPETAPPTRENTPIQFRYSTPIQKKSAHS